MRTLIEILAGLAILANAVIQWIPDHERLLPALMAKLAPGGSLAVQVLATGAPERSRSTRKPGRA